MTRRIVVAVALAASVLIGSAAANAADVPVKGVMVCRTPFVVSDLGVWFGEETCNARLERR